MVIDSEVRVGDRYLHGPARITITAVDGNHISISAIDGETGNAWTDRGLLPVPSNWEKVGSGPKLVPMCLSCDKEEAEPGMLFCFECTNAQAASGNWNHVTAEGAAALAEVLRLKEEGGS